MHVIPHTIKVSLFKLISLCIKEKWSFKIFKEKITIQNYYIPVLLDVVLLFKNIPTDLVCIFYFRSENWNALVHFANLNFKKIAKNSV